MKFFAAILFVAALTCSTCPAQDSLAEFETVQIEAAQLQLIVNVEIAAGDAGVIERLSVREGANVEEGEILLTLDRARAKAQSITARSEYEIAKEENENDIDLKFAKVSEEVSCQVYKRSLQAIKQYAKSVSKTELERLKLEYERARLSGEQAERTAATNELNVELRKAQLDLATVELENREIKTPVSGLVVQVYRQVGEWVQPGQPVARVINLKKLRVSCRCYLNDASPETIAEEATFVRDGKEFKAKVVFASPEIDPDVQDFIVWAEVENPNGNLKPGMSGSIVLRKKELK